MKRLILIVVICFLVVGGEADNLYGEEGESNNTGDGTGASQHLSQDQMHSGMSIVRESADDVEKESYGRDDLKVGFISLSYVSTDNCLEILEKGGYTVGDPEFPVDADSLPLVFSVPDAKNISVVESEGLDNVGDSGVQQRIGIMYDEDHKEQYVRLLDFIEDEIDIAAKQVQIEAMVIELREEGTRELGLEYEWEKGGAVEAPNDASRYKQADFNPEGDGFFGVSTMSFNESGTPELFQARLKALMKDHEAEILSSPSVLTLDGRHAHIEIAEDVPIIEQSKYQSSDQWDMNVRFVEAGILLSINPRVSNDGKWVTMQVQTEVSEENESDAVTTRDGEFVAPRIERRKVQSMSRIRNNHPFIIGGLIRDSSNNTVEKIPLLGDIPLLGHLFRKSESKDEKREIIIVLTPRVIERGSSDRAITPKDSDKFDNFDTHLFRETYTLKSEDIYDLGFVLDRKDIQRTLERGQEEIQYNPELADAKPYSLVADGGIPGEEAIVNRMLYDVVRKLELFREISLDKLIFFQPDDSDPSGFHVTWLEQELEKIAGDKTVDQHLESDYPKDVLYVIYEMDEELGDKPNLRYPVATTKVESHSDSDSAEARLYELGKVEGTSRDRIAFMIGSKRDLERLKISIIVREILNINDPSSLQQLDNFTVKRRIAIPEVDPEGDRTFLIDRRVAKPFFMSNFYYAEFQEIFQSVIEDLRNDLK